MCSVLFSSKLKPAELLLFFLQVPNMGRRVCLASWHHFVLVFQVFELRMLSSGVAVFQQASLLASQ